jgi:hypothetical protein
MPRVQIPGVGIVQFSDKLSEQEIMSQAEAMQKQAQQPLLDPRELGIGQLIGGGFSRGIESLKGTAFDLLPALGASLIGKDAYAKEQLQEYRDRMAAVEEEAPTAYKSYKDIGSIGQAFGFAAETLGEIGPDVASFLVGAGAGSVAGKAIAKKTLEKEIRDQAAETAARKGLDKAAEKDLADRLMSRAKQGAVGAKATEAGANIGLKTGLGGTSMGINVPDVLNSVYEDTGELSPGIALTIGSLVAALDTYLPSKILSQLSPSAKERIAAQMLQKSDVVPISWKKAFAGEVLKTASGEALTEGAQEALTKLGSQIAGDTDPFFSQENIDQILTSSLKGFIGGGAFGAPGAAVEAKRTKDERAGQIAEKEARDKAIKDMLAPPATPALGYTPQTMPVSPEGQAMNPQQAEELARQRELAEFEKRAGTAPVEGYQPDLFPDELQRAQAEQAIGALRPTIDQALAGPPAEPLAGREFTTSGLAPDQVPTEFKTVLDADLLKATGLKPSSGFYKKLLNKDMADPADQVEVRDLLVQIRQNPNLADSTKQATESIAMQAFGALAKQREMFGPRGGILRERKNGRVQPGPVGGVGGAGVSVPSEREGEGAAPGTTTPEERGLAPAAATTDVTAGREELQSGALKPATVVKTAQEVRFGDSGTKGVLLTLDNGKTIEVTQYSPNEFIGPNGETLGSTLEEAAATIISRETTNPVPAMDEARRVELVKALEEKAAQRREREERRKNKVIDLADEMKARDEKRESRLDDEDEALEAAEQAAKMARTTPSVSQAPAVGAVQGVPQGAGPAVSAAAATTAPAEAVASKAAAKAPKAIRTEEGNQEFQELGRPSETNFTDFIGKGYLGFAAEDIQNIDDSIKIADVVQGKFGVNPMLNAAKIYFSKMPRTVDNLINIAFDLAFNTPAFRQDPEDPQSADEVAFFKGMGGKNARFASTWVYQNLSEEARQKLRYFVSRFEQARDRYTDKQLMELIREGISGVREEYNDETAKSYIAAQEAEMAAARNRAERRAIFPNAEQRRQDIAEQEAFEKELAEIQSKQARKLLDGPIAQLGMPLHPVIAARLVAGDLVGALRMLSAHPNNFIARSASRLANANLQTKLVIQEGLYNQAGKPVPGYYDPTTDTVYIDPNSGMNVHTLLHEAGHGATSHVMDNSSHPLTKQVNGLLNDIRDSLGSAYGATNADEFLAEAQSNPEFKALLQSIYPNGKSISAWDKLVRMVSNFMRRLFGLPQRPLESAFDQVDRFIDAVISPAPESRDAGLLFAAANTGMAGKVFDRLGTTLEALPGMTPERADSIHEFLKNTVGGNFRSFMLSVLPLNALSDIAKTKGLKDAPTVDRLVNERSGYEYKLNERIEPLVKRADEFAKKESQAQVDVFNKIVYDSTLNKVDPTKKRSDYKTPEQQKAWDDIQNDWKKLGGAGRALYANMRDAYKDMYQRIIDAIGERIDASVTDPARAKVIKKDIYERLVTKGTIDPYFPLARYGKYWLSYSARDDAGQMEFFVEAFETERERSRYMQQLEQSGATDVQAFSNLSELNYRRVPSGSFVNGVLQVMELNKVPTEATEEVLRLFLSTLPETAFAQSFQRRKETLGFNKDAIRALRERAYRTSHQLASMRYAAKLNEVLDNMKDYARGVGKGAGEEGQKDNRVINEYVKEFEKRISYINNPTVSKWSQVATSFGFNMTLGFNVSSALINLTQVPLILYPYLSATYGYGATSRAIGDAYKVYLNSGFAREVEIIGSNGQIVRQKAMPALDNYNFDDPALPPQLKRLRTLARVARDQGQLNRSQLYDILEVDERNNALSKINAASGFIFHHGERFNRQVSLVAAYNLELDRMMKKPTKEEAGLTQEQKEEKAANHAVYTAELTNGGISAAAAPRIAQSSLGKVLFMFKRYGVSMYYLLFKTAREALKNEDPAVRSAAMRQIAGIYGTAALFAGIQGLPLFGIAAMVYNAFAGDDEDDFETATRKYLGELPYKGLLNYVSNVEIASRTGLSDLIIRDSGKQDSQTVALTMMEMLGGPVFGVASRVERGLDMIRDGNVARGIENILPSSVSNILKGIRYATEGTTTLRGDPITGEVNSWNIAAQMFGFAPADYTRQLEINNRMKGVDKSVNQEQTKLKRQYYLASRMGDTEGKQEAREKLLELGARHPSLEITAGSIDDILERSIAAQKRVTERMRNGVAYSPKMLKEIEQSLKEFED